MRKSIEKRFQKKKTIVARRENNFDEPDKNNRVNHSMR